MEPYNQLCALAKAQLTTALGRRPAGLIVAPCRVPGYHLYSNAGFFTDKGLPLVQVCPPGWMAEAQGGFINYRLSEAVLRSAVQVLAAQPVSQRYGAEQAARCSRLEALLALRADEKQWGPEGEALAWLLVRSLPPVGKTQMDGVWRAFELYFRCGKIDHTMIRALRLRLAQTC